MSRLARRRLGELETGEGAITGMTATSDLSARDPADPATGPTDAEVIVRSRADPDAFAELFDRHAEFVGRYLGSRVGPGPAEDLLAETFTIAWERRDAFDEAYADARPWLFGIATNLIRGHRRAESRRLRLLAKMDSSDAIVGTAADEVGARVDAQRLAKTLAAALAALPAGDRDTLLLSALAGFSHAEIARALGVPEGTVRSRLHRAKTKLRTALIAKHPTLRFDESEK